MFGYRWLYNREMKKAFSRHPWTHTASLTFKYSPSLADAERLLKEWRLKIIKGENIQLANMGVFNHLPRRHIHLLMFGRNQDGKTLLKVNTVKMERLWRSGEAKVKQISDYAGAIGYLVDQNMPRGRHELIIPFNKKLLDKSEIGTEHERR